MSRSPCCNEEPKANRTVTRSASPPPVRAEQSARIVTSAESSPPSPIRIEQSQDIPTFAEALRPSSVRAEQPAVVQPSTECPQPSTELYGPLANPLPLTLSLPHLWSLSCTSLPGVESGLGTAKDPFILDDTPIHFESIFAQTSVRNLACEMLKTAYTGYAVSSALLRILYWIDLKKFGTETVEFRTSTDSKVFHLDHIPCLRPSACLTGGALQLVYGSFSANHKLLEHTDLTRYTIQRQSR